jgi:hypothetical protein
MSSLKDARFLRVLISEEYEGREGKRKSWLQVGSAWVKTSKSGEEYISLRIVPGLSISGELVIMPAKDREEQADSQQPRHETHGDDGGEKRGKFRAGGRRP